MISEYLYRKTKLIIFLIIILIPSKLYAGGVANDIREMIGEGAIFNFIGLILTAIFGYIVGYALLVFVYFTKYIFNGNKPIFKNTKNAASAEVGSFTTYFIISFVFIVPFVMIPTLIFTGWIEKISFIATYVINAVFSILIATLLTFLL